LADCDSATAAVRSPYGIALHGSLANQPLTVIKSGPVTIGAALTAGVAYYLSATAGGICPVADLASGDYPVILGIATSTTVLDVDIQEAGVALA
jgi:predicted lysophospholipase L1 biosynthesis ABC-type transport system permease subunit